MIKITVPATTANLGVGFDTFGMALSLYNSFYIDIIDTGLEFDNVDSKYQNKNNLVIKTINRVLSMYNHQMPGIYLKMETNIPVSGGLGSSATCIVAGVFAANYIMDNKLSIDDIYSIASKLEGHPDNIAPAIFGGFTVSFIDDEGALYNKSTIENNLKYYVLIPNLNVATVDARKVLPSKIEFKHAVHNLSRVSMFPSALKNGDIDILNRINGDMIHEPYRKQLIPDYEAIKQRFNTPLYISGSGPTLFLISEEESIVLPIDLVSNWKIYKLDIDNIGTQIEVI